MFGIDYLVFLVFLVQLVGGNGLFYIKDVNYSYIFFLVEVDLWFGNMGWQSGVQYV